MELPVDFKLVSDKLEPEHVEIDFDDGESSLSCSPCITDRYLGDICPCNLYEASPYVNEISCFFRSNEGIISRFFIKRKDS